MTFYGPESLQPVDTPDFDTVIVVDVHERVQSSTSSYNLTSGSRRVSYGTDHGVTLVSAYVDRTTEMDIQFPASAP